MVAIIMRYLNKLLNVDNESGMKKEINTMKQNAVNALVNNCRLSFEAIIKNPRREN